MTITIDNPKAKQKMVASKKCKICGGTGIEQMFYGGVVKVRRCRCVHFKNTEVANGK